MRMKCVGWTVGVSKSPVTGLESRNNNDVSRANGASADSPRRYLTTSPSSQAVVPRTVWRSASFHLILVQESRVPYVLLDGNNGIRGHDPLRAAR